MLRNQALEVRAPSSVASSNAGGDRSSQVREVPATGQVDARQLRALLPAIRSPENAALLEALANRFGGMPENLPSRKSLRSISRFVFERTGTRWSAKETANAIYFWADVLRANHKSQPQQAREDQGLSQFFPNANHFGVNTMYITINNHHWLPLH
ncbi:hypothetical protein NMY22_g3253 [Coprinellus aureogranulatus]|nr:hypothetical protein NMY22_g3253 [Coprinellus aureogranulatus]